MNSTASNMTRDDLANMDRDELSEFFMENARYDPRNKTSPYFIASGGFNLTSDDTLDLSRRFQAAVRRYRGALHGRCGAFPR